MRVNHASRGPRAEHAHHTRTRTRTRARTRARPRQPRQSSGLVAVHAGEPSEHRAQPVEQRHHRFDLGIGSKSQDCNASKAAAASDASPLAVRNREIRSAPVRLDASAMPRYADNSAPKLVLQQAQDRVPMGCHPPRVRQRQRVLPAVPAVASGRRVPHDARGDGPLLRPACWRRPELVLARQRHCQGTKRGDLTGPSPTDRAKLGTKRHILTDADGVPLAVTITGANVHDKWMVGQTLDAMVLRGPRGPRRPKSLCLDKGYDYDYADCEQEVRRRRIVPHIRRRGEPPLVGCVHGRPRRWVVERTNSWHNRYRGLLIRWERKAENYLAFVRLACPLIAFNAASRA